MLITKITQPEFKTTAWSGGTTDEIFIFPEGSSYKERKFNIRISSAVVDLEESEFTLLPNIHRFICPLNNQLQLFSKTNLNLDEANKKPLADLKPFEIFEFDGDTPIISRGKCRDFNLMIKGNYSANLAVWNTENEGVKKIEFKKAPLLFWFFSYKSEGALFIDDTEVQINKMEFIKVENLSKKNTSGYLELKTNLKTKLLYGMIY